MEPKEQKESTSPQITTLKRNKDNNKTVTKTIKKILKPGEKKKKQRSIVIGAVKQLVQYLESNCIELEGICRISGNNIQVKQLKKQLENGDGDTIDFSKLDSHVVSGTLKSFLRDSDEPLLTFDLYKNFLAVIDIKDKNSKISFIKSLLSALPKDNYDLLQILLKFLYTIQLHSATNKMTSSNLAIVFSPTLLRPKEESLETMMADSNSISEVVRVLIEEFHVLYEIKQTILYQVSSIDLGIKEDKRSSSEQLEDAKVTIEQLKKHLDEEARERSILETYCTSMEQKLQELQDINKSMTEEKESLGELLNEYREINKNQSNEIITLKTKVEYITDLQSKTESEKNDLNNIKLNLEKIIESNKIEIKSINDQNQTLKSNINKLNQDLNNQSKQFESFKKDTLVLQKSENEKFETFKKESIELQKSENDKFKLQIDQLNKEKLESNAQVERVQAEISILLSSSNDKNSKKSSLKNQKKELDNSLKRNKEQESKITQLEKEKLKLSEELLKLQQQQQKPSSSSSTPASSSSSSSSSSHKFVFGKKPNNKTPTPTTTTTTITTPPPAIDEDDIISVKKFAFYYMNLAIKTDAMNKGLPCNINSSEILDELLTNNIKVQSWSEIISKKLKENK